MKHVALHAQPGIGPEFEPVARAVVRAMSKISDDGLAVSIFPQHQAEITLMLEIFGMWPPGHPLEAMVLLRDGDDVTSERGWTRKGRMDFYRLLTTVNRVFFYEERTQVRLPLLDWRMQHATHLVVVRDSWNTAFADEYITAALSFGKEAIRVDPINHRVTKMTGR